MGDPSSYWERPPSQGGVSERANFHAKPGLCIFLVFWGVRNANLHVLFWGLFFCKKIHLHFPAGAEMLKKCVC